MTFVETERNITPLHDIRNLRKTFFRANDGISDALLADLHGRGIKYGLTSIVPFPVAEIVVAHWVGLKCRYGCSQFNANWSCPPATPDILSVRELLSEYTSGLLLAGNRQCRDFYRNTGKHRAEQVRYWKGTVSLERHLFLSGYDKAFSLVSGACALCKRCAYPRNCRFPMEKRPTVESFSIDLIGTLKHIGIDTKVATDLKEAFTYYSIILLD